MENCVFCKVVARELPSYKIYEDDNFLGILDIHPVSKGHSLVIPKKHFTWVHDVEPFGDYWIASRKIARATQKGLNTKWVQYFTHGLIPHAHIHILPRYDELGVGPAVQPEEPKLKLSKEEFEQIASKIRKAL